MDLCHLFRDEPDKTDEGVSQVWLFFDPFCLEIVKKIKFDFEHKITHAWPANEYGSGMRKSANPN
jgi:hypothetical protein